jgi:hypothetical protein
MRTSWAAALLLTACASQPDLLSLAEAHAPFPAPLTQDKYAYIVPGLYVDRAIQVDGSEIAYRVVYDNRELKSFLATEFKTGKAFDQGFASFIEHKGVVQCPGRNAYLLSRLDARMQPVKVEPKAGTTEVSDTLCLLLNLTSKEKSQ